MECEGFYSLASYMRHKIGCFLSPVSEWSSEFSDKALEDVGFLPAMREASDLYEAYSRTAPKMSLGEREREDIERFCASFGKGYADEEMKLLDAFCERLGEHIEYERSEMPRSQRLVRTMCISCAVAVSILII